MTDSNDVLYRTRTSGICPGCGRTTREIRTEHRNGIGICYACYTCRIHTAIHPINSIVKIHLWRRRP